MKNTAVNTVNNATRVSGEEWLAAAHDMGLPDPDEGGIVEIESMLESAPKEVTGVVECLSEAVRHYVYLRGLADGLALHTRFGGHHLDDRERVKVAPVDRVCEGGCAACACA